MLGGGDAGEVPVLALGGSVATPPEGIEAELVVVRGFEALAAMGERARGKIVLFNRAMPRALRNTFRAYGAAVPQRTNGAVEAAKVGAVAALVRSMTTRVDDVPHTGALRYRDGVPRVPAAAVSTAGADRLAALVKAGKPVRVRLRLSCQTLADVPSANVIGEIPGTDKADEVVVIGAHLDSWDVGEGAHDDGAGCAHALEAMRLIGAVGLRPARTIRAVLFINEENGLRGARAYADEHRDELAKHFAVGRRGFRAQGFPDQRQRCSARRTSPAGRAVAGARHGGDGARWRWRGHRAAGPCRDHSVWPGRRLPPLLRLPPQRQGSVGGGQ